MKLKNRPRTFQSAIAFVVVFLILCTPTLSLGWGAGGHMMTASIAFSRLNPRAKAKANELLAIKIDPASITAKSLNFVNAAHWPDDLRPFSEFDKFKPLHFIDQPFSTDGTALPAGVPEPDNIVKALEDNVNILKTSSDKNAQAQALRFIIHFVGDIHQPLHCATRVSSANPQGDRGGNLVNIKVPGTGSALKSTNLHSYWDGGIGTFPKTGPNFAPPPLSQIPAAIATAKRGNPANDPKIKLDNPTDYMGWANESFELAKTVAYDGIDNGSKPDAKYRSKATKVARQRVAWGGYRLAALLNSIWP
jgi:S1/P1 nuclease